MMKYNVKKIENTNTMTTTLTTSCKKRDTAISRFCRFLSEYDSCFKDSLLIATAKIYYAGDTECCLYKADIETDEYIMVYTEYTPMNENTNNNVVFTLIIKFKHDENTTTYKSLANTYVSNNTNDNETATDSADGNDNETPQPCHIKAYYDGKELTVPYSEYKCKKHAVEYIHNLYIDRVVPYETLFMIYYGKHVETITIENVIDTSDLLQYNIDDINHGLKHDCYKYVREGVNHICDIITDDMKISIDLDKTQYCTITKSRYSGYYCFKFVKTVYTKKPCDFARWLYTQTFTHRIDLKCWNRDLRGDSK